MSRSLVFPRGLVRAAGAMVWRFSAGGEAPKPGEPISADDIEVLLIHRPKYRDWSWPKGKAEYNETIPAAGVREVEEETGHVVQLGAPLTTQRYRLGSGHLKEVYYWVGQALSSESARLNRPLVVPASKKEIDIVRWMTPDEARQKLSRRGDRRLLTELITRATRGELVTSATILLAHAEMGDEGEQSLSRLGAAQSLDLLPIMSAFGVQKVYAAGPGACSQTVAPYAAVGATELVVKDHLANPAGDGQTKTDRFITKLIRKKSGARAVSVNAAAYQRLVAELHEYATRDLVTQMGQPQLELAPAEMLVAHIAHANKPRVVAVERHVPFTKAQFGLGSPRQASPSSPTG